MTTSDPAEGAGPPPMRRVVTADLAYWVGGPATIELQVAVSTHQGQQVEETLTVTSAGAPVAVEELVDEVGNRHHLVQVGAGQLDVHYDATVTGRVDPPPVTSLDPLVLTRPSRYCESDELAGFAAAEFAGLTSARELLPAVSSWVGDRLEYVSGSSGPTDGAVATLLARRGVCRDYAHLTVAMLRACGVPARVVAVYAPGLFPMDFHSVVEAIVDGVWRVVDATLLAPRSSLLRISTGRDAADTSFLSGYGGLITLNYMEVTAITDGMLPGDDVLELVSLG